MYSKISTLTTLVAVLYVLAFFLSTGKGEEAKWDPNYDPNYDPKYWLYAVTATGADCNEYDINNHRNFIYIRNIRNKKKVWEMQLNLSGTLGFTMRIAPDKKHALLFLEYSPQGQVLYWLQLPEGKPSYEYIDDREFEKQIAKACGDLHTDEWGWYLNEFFFSFLDWDAQGRCRLKWRYSVPHEGGDDTTNTGIAIVTINSNGKPGLSLDSFLTDVEDMNKVRYGKHVTLRK